MTSTKNFYNFSIGAGSHYEDLPDGGLLIHDVVVMASGTWTSMQGAVTVFGEDVLARDAQNWTTRTVWTRHSGGAPRDADEIVGAVRAVRYDPARKAVVGDVYLSRQTTRSADMAKMVRMPREQGGITDVSAETVLELDARSNVTHVTFTGLALVESGACEVCKVPAYSKSGTEAPADAAGGGKTKMADETQPGTSPAEGENKDIEPKSIEGQIIDQLLPLLEQQGFDLSGLLKDILASQGDEVKAAESMGRLKERVSMACKMSEPDGSVDKLAGKLDKTEEKALDKAAAPYSKLQEQLTQFGAKIAELEGKISVYEKKTVTVAKGPGAVDYSSSGETRSVSARGKTIGELRNY